jgi:hypothetical protein
MMFVIGEDDKGNVIVKKTSSVGKTEQLIFLIERIPLQIRESARTKILTRQQGCTLKYKRYELRIYSRLLKAQ